MRKNFEGIIPAVITITITLNMFLGTVFAATTGYNKLETKTEATLSKNYEVETTTHQFVTAKDLSILTHVDTIPKQMTKTEITNKIKKSGKIKTVNKIKKVKNVKVRIKKTMKVSSQQKIKIVKVLPKSASNKEITIKNKTKNVLKVKNNKITAKKSGTGKLVIKSKDGGLIKTIKIKVKKPVPKCQGVKLLYSRRYNVTSNPLTRSMGRKFFNGHSETYYSENVLPGCGLKIPGRHVADDGTIRDKDGYIVVATNFNFRAKYSTFLTSLGPAKVYDTGCAYGTVDIYCNW